MIEPFHQLCYESENKQVCWQGIAFKECESFQSFLTNNVAERLDDQEMSSEFESHLLGLVGTGFSRECLEPVFDADSKEERDWAAGEALAESWLEKEHQVIWPWNMEQDKRTPKASLPGADLIGFQEAGNEIRLVLGEVKSSSQEKYPPNVMSGKSGLKHQLETLTINQSIIFQILKWLYVRCKNNEFEDFYIDSTRLFIQSGYKAVALFGILIRDTELNELDLKARGKSLGELIEPPACCQLMALHLPFNLSELPMQIHGGKTA